MIDSNEMLRYIYETSDMGCYGIQNVENALCAPFEVGSWATHARGLLEAADPRVDGARRAAALGAGPMAGRTSAAAAHRATEAEESSADGEARARAAAAAWLREQIASIRKEADGKLRQRGIAPEGIGPMAKLSSRMMSGLKTMTNQSPSHIAEMMIEGNTMGMTKSIQHLHDYREDGEVRALANQLLKTEENNIRQMKQFQGLHYKKPGQQKLCSGSNRIYCPLFSQVKRPAGRAVKDSKLDRSVL